ncbi:hypothetical protein BKA62DRAFT_431226 [Auriculariales sp. MPI-PUGE-AT-0066]|nr:hypothetical protein BKA62DRAFT_431226 [Auriculariales sp. MPI-PUGE-AT-0066]
MDRRIVCHAAPAQSPAYNSQQPDQQYYYYGAESSPAQLSPPAQQSSNPDSLPPTTPRIFSTSSFGTGFSPNSIEKYAFSSYYANQNSPSRLLYLSNDFYDNSNIRSTRSNSNDSSCTDDMAHSGPSSWEFSHPHFQHAYHHYSLSAFNSPAQELSSYPYLPQSPSQYPSRILTPRSSLGNVYDDEHLASLPATDAPPAEESMITARLNMSMLDPSLDDSGTHSDSDDGDDVSGRMPDQSEEESTRESPAAQYNTMNALTSSLAPVSPDAKVALRGVAARQKELRRNGLSGASFSPEPPLHAVAQSGPRTIYNATPVSLTQRKTRNSISAASIPILDGYPFKKTPTRPSYPYELPPDMREAHETDARRPVPGSRSLSPSDDWVPTTLEMAPKLTNYSGSSAESSRTSHSTGSGSNNGRDNSGWTTPDSTDRDLDDDDDYAPVTNKAAPVTRRRTVVRTRPTELEQSIGPVRTKQASPRPAMYTKPSDPVPVPNLTKKSRGRAVPTTPFVIEAGITKQLRLYTCTVNGCGKCFARGEHLKRHIRSIHTRERPFACSVPGCGKGFSRHDNLKQHMRVHEVGGAIHPSKTSKRGSSEEDDD